MFDLSTSSNVCAQVLLKSMDAAATTADKMEFCVLSQDGDRGVVQRIVPEAAVAKLIAEVQAEAAPEGDV